MGIVSVAIKARGFFWEGIAVTTGKAPLARLRGSDLINKLFTHKAKLAQIPIFGHQGKVFVRVQAYEVSHKALKRLGLNNSLLKNGPLVCVLKKDQYNKYCLAIGADPSQLAGVYGPKGIKEQEEVDGGARTYLTFNARKIFVPEDVDFLTLCHEVLHDYFMNFFDTPLAGKTDTQRNRDFYTQLIIQEVRRSADKSKKPRGVSVEEQFFQEVAERCSTRYDLKSLIETPVDVTRGRWGDVRYVALSKETQLFVRECFAYGGATLATEKKWGGVGEQGMGKVPKELEIALRKVVLA
ncbi:MAG: hypothetical protein ABIH50_05910 [bacterium]